MSWIIAISFIVFLFFFCCCRPTCYFAQNFNSRTIISGEWAFSGTNSAVATTEDDDAALMLSRHPGEEINVTLGIQMSSDTPGDALRLWFGGVDYDDCIVLELVIGDSGTAGIARVIEREAGVDSIVGDDVYLRGSNDAQILVIYKPNGAASEVRVQISRQLVGVGDYTLTQFQRTVISPGGWKAGIATAEIAGTATFKNFGYSRYFLDFPDCGGGAGCILHADLFADSGNAETTEEWVTVDGSWTMGGNLLTCSSPGRLRSKVVDFSGKNRQRISSQIDLSGGVDPPDWGIWFDAIDDDNYHQARIEIRGGGAYLIIEKVTAGVATLLKEWPLFYAGNNDRRDQLFVCTREGAIYATTMGEDYPPFGPASENNIGRASWQVTTTLHGGQSAGLLVTSGECRFKYWRYAVQKAPCDEVDPEWPCTQCAPCGGDGDDDGDKPAIWKLVIAGITNGVCTNCGIMNGTYICEAIYFFSGGGTFNGYCIHRQVAILTTSICGNAGDSRVIVEVGGSSIAASIFYGDVGAGGIDPHSRAAFTGIVPVECDKTTIADLPLTLDTTDPFPGKCNVSGVTALLTAIPGAN